MPRPCTRRRSDESDPRRHCRGHSPGIASQSLPGPPLSYVDTEEPRSFLNVTGVRLGGSCITTGASWKPLPPGGRAGATVGAVGSAREALETFRFGAPDVVVSDIAMPETDGYEVVRQVRAMQGSAARTPMVALTAYASREHRDAAVAAGYDAYLVKPAEAATLSRIVAELFRDRLLRGD